jgi:hypothetical protein
VDRPLHGTFTYTPPHGAWGSGRVDLRKCGTIPASGIEGITGESLERNLLSVCLSCGHTGAFDSFSAIPFARGIALRARCRMGP